MHSPGQPGDFPDLASSLAGKGVILTIPGRGGIKQDTARQVPRGALVEARCMSAATVHGSAAGSQAYGLTDPSPACSREVAAVTSLSSLGERMRVGGGGTALREAPLSGATSLGMQPFMQTERSTNPPVSAGSRVGRLRPQTQSADWGLTQHGLEAGSGRSGPAGEAPVRPLLTACTRVDGELSCLFLL